jgi:hypothetical protein
MDALRNVFDAPDGANSHLDTSSVESSPACLSAAFITCMYKHGMVNYTALCAFMLLWFCS